jgi:hypothetical protein
MTVESFHEQNLGSTSGSALRSRGGTSAGLVLPATLADGANDARTNDGGLLLL